MGAEALTLALSCPALGLSLRASVEAEPLRSAIPAGGRRLRVMHAKRDGQVCFAHLEPLSGLPEGDRTSGEPGDLFLFGGDPAGPRRERSGQLVLVYGYDNQFVRPFERGGQPRGYRRIGSAGDIEALRRIGEHIWRHGAVEIDAELLD